MLLFSNLCLGSSERNIYGIEEEGVREKYVWDITHQSILHEMNFFSSTEPPQHLNCELSAAALREIVDFVLFITTNILDYFPSPTAYVNV